MTERIFLVGMMGSGKTTVGRALAERLGYPYLDSDEQVEAQTGQTVAEIFASRGEAAFRVHEKEALFEALRGQSPVVVAVAGGAVLDAENRMRLSQDGFVVWLRADVTTLARRARGGDHRPLLENDLEGTIGRLYEQRRPHYAELADLVVDVDRLSVEQVVDVVYRQVRNLGLGVR